MGALFVRRSPRVRLKAQMHGGGHERGMRSGTLPTHQIVGMGEAFELAGKNLESEQKRIRVLRDKLWNGLQGLEQVFLNGHPEYNVANYLNVSFNFVEGESLMMALKDAAVSSGSACTSATLEPSYVLRALGLSDELAHSSIRFSFGTYTTEEDIDHVLEITKAAVEKLRDLSPLWDMYKEGIDLSTVEWAEH
jgi:cysteine desulfurase